jgi:adenine-specific DNA-methyltransferase
MERSVAELIWEGKYRDRKKVAPVRLALPFQTVETINESAQDRARTLDLFSSGKPTDWRNRLIWGDKRYVLPSLLPEFSRKVNLIYIDPPFDTGADFSYTAEVPGSKERFDKEPSMIEQKAYRDTWGQGLDSYVRWLYETALILRDLLADNGSLYVHLDQHVGHYAKVVLDEVLGQAAFQSEVVWKRTGAHNAAERFGPIHDVIYYYAIGEGATWNQQFQAYDEAYKDKFNKIDAKTGAPFQDVTLTGPGVRHGLSGDSWRGFNPTEASRHWALASNVYAKYKQVTGNELKDFPLLERLDRLDEVGLIYWPKKTGGQPRYKLFWSDCLGVPLQDVWGDIDAINSQADERVGYPTQKPESLLERIVKVSSNPGDLVLDCFCGAGTTAAVAEKLGRRWIAGDLARFAIHTTRKRLLAIPGLRPFTVQNLGKYERQAWMKAEFEHPEDRAAMELAYRHFILDLFHAEPLSGSSWLHGVKAGRMVHIGAVDAPVTLADVKAIASEVWKVVGSRKGEGFAAADILGWEFAFELNETAKQLAAEARVDVKFRRIPREVLEKAAVDQGDIQAKDFFELRALSAKVTKARRKLTVELTDFMLPVEDLPEEIARAVKHWSQWIDYWAVDWDYRGDTFHNQWQAFRTRDKETLDLKVMSPEYREPGAYTVVVKVIDILGNDTTKSIDVEVK